MRYNAYDISITTYCQLFCAGCQRNDEDNNLSKELVQEHMQYETFCMIMDQIDTMPVYCLGNLSRFTGTVFN